MRIDTSKKVLKEIDMLLIRETLTERHMSCVYTTGTFDLGHPGYPEFLESAAAYADVLFVGVDDDKLVHKYKRRQSILNEEDRKRLVAGYHAVNYVFLVSDFKKSLELLRPNVLVISQTTLGERFVHEITLATEMGVKVIRTCANSKIHASGLIRQIRGSRSSIPSM